jgi:hypothetical protein
MLRILPLPIEGTRVPLTHEQIKALGAAILAAANDKFGLKTDGQGNVIIPEGSSFMAQVLKLDKKYIALADYNHDDTFEQVFTEQNVAEMKRAGVRHIYAEHDILEGAFLKKIAIAPEFRIAVRHPMTRNYAEAVKNLIGSGIDYIPSDPRDKYTHNAEKEADILLLEKAENILEPLLSASKNTTGQEYTDAFKKWQSTYMTVPTNVACLKKANTIVLMNLKEDSDVAEQQRGFAFLTDNVAPTSARTSDIEGFSYNLLVTKAKIRSWDAKKDSVEDMIREMQEMNPALANRIFQESQDSKKVIIRWGLGHFNNVGNPHPDLNELLGKDKSLVIATAYDEVEFERVKTRICTKRMADLPDYIYMPTRTDEDGTFIPEKAISVAEYLAAQEKKEKAPELPQKGNGRR